MEKKKENMINIPSLQQLLEAGVHFGHQVRRGHPKMGEYIFGVREGVHIINLESSEKLLKEAAEYAYNLGKESKVLLFVGTKKQAQPIIGEAAKEANAPYITYRWIGGLLTNFDEIRKNIRKLLDLKDKKEKGQLSHYTKKEQLLISRKLEKFETEAGGIAALEKLPDALFLSDAVTEKTALYEANRINIPVIAIADTNSNPLLVNFPIPGNDDAAKSIKILTDTITQAYKDGLVLAGKKKREAEEKVETKSEGETVVVGEDLAAQVEEAEKIVEKKAVEESSRAEE